MYGLLPYSKDGVPQLLHGQSWSADDSFNPSKTGIWLP